MLPWVHYGAAEKEQAGPSPRGNDSNESLRKIKKTMCTGQVAKYE